MSRSLPLLLLVDDGPEIALIVRQLGKWAGHDMISCPDVASAWEYLGRVLEGNEPRPQLVIVDVNLPGPSGLELGRRIRQTPGLAELPVALFGSWERAGDIAAGLQAGIDVVLAKDLLGQPDSWRARLEEILSPLHGRAAADILGFFRGHEALPSAGEVLEAINQSLRHATVRRLGWEVVRVLVCRAGNGLALTAAADPADWPLTENFALGPALASLHSPDVLYKFALSLAWQVQRLLGTSASEPFRTTLRDALDCRTTPRMKPVHAILLVEDNPADVVITERALRASGRAVELIVVRDGQEAVDYLLRRDAFAQLPDWRRPDLILLDLNLPRLNGLDVVKQVRATPQLRVIPVVVLTTSRRREDIQELYAAGANTYIEKPQDFQTFVEVLRTMQHYWLDLALLPTSTSLEP